MKKQNYLIGRKFTGVKFKDCSFPGWSSSMNDYIGVEGTITERTDRGSYKVVFPDGNNWLYPKSVVEEQLSVNVPTLEGVMMEVSDDISFVRSCERLVYGRVNGVYIVRAGDNSSLYEYKFARPIQPKVTEISMQDIANKFGVNIDDLKITK